MVATAQPFSNSSSAEPVRGFLHLPEVSAGPAAALVLTHSAGGNCQAPLLVAVAEAFAAVGITVLRCDLPFRQERPTGPPLRTAARDQAGLRAAVEVLRKHLAQSDVADDSTAQIYLGGHSYGGRMASMLSADEPGLVEGLLLLSYPLHPPRKPQQLRTGHFAALRTPALFISGVRDGFGSIPELEAAIAQIPARTELVAVKGAGHELMGKSNREQLPQTVVDAFMAFYGAR
jgi:uncharacterized protein